MTDGAAARAAPSIAAVVLAAGVATRFGGGKIRAMLDGRPLVAHVLAAARAAGIGRIVLVLGRDAVDVRSTLVADDASVLDVLLLAVNPAPERGLASSLQLGLTAATSAPAPAGVLVLLGDQPRVRPAVIEALVAAARQAPVNALAVAPAYADDSAQNPVLVLPAGWPAAAALQGDRGLGALLAAAPERVLRVPVTGANPDVDTPADLLALATPEGSRP